MEASRTRWLTIPMVGYLVYLFGSNWLAWLRHDVEATYFVRELCECVCAGRSPRLRQVAHYGNGTVRLVT